MWRDLVTPCDNTTSGQWIVGARRLLATCLVVLCTTCNREMEANNKEHERRRRTRLHRRCCLYSIIYNVFIWFGSQDPFRAPQVQLWLETELQSEVSELLS